MDLDRSGHLWAAGDSALFRREGERWRRLDAPPGWATGLFHDREDSLWSWQTGVGLHRVLGDGRWESWTREEGLPGDTVWSIHRDRAGRLWVGTSEGLVRATPGGWVPVAGTAGLAVRSIAEAADGTLWLGTLPTQVLHFDPRSGRLRRFGEARGVRARKILHVAVDRRRRRLGGDGGRWSPSPPGGSGGFRTGSGSRSTPPTRVIAFALEDSEGRFWIGGPGGLAVRERVGWRRFTRADGLLADEVEQMTETAAGEFWIAYDQKVGITHVRFDHGGLRVLGHRDASSGLTPARPYFLGAGRHGRLWLGLGNGVDVVSERGISHFDTTDGLVGDDCSYMAFWTDANGDVLVGTSRGLSRLRGGEDPPPREAPEAAIVGAALGGETVAAGSGRAIEVPRRRHSLEVRFAALSFHHQSDVRYQVRLLGLESGWRESLDRDALYPSLPQGRYVFEVRARIGSGPWGAPARLPFTILPSWWETWPVRLLAALLAVALALGGVKLRVRRLEHRQVQLEAVVAERTAELEDVNESLRIANELFERLSVTDALTGVANRRAFDRQLDLEWRRCLREQRPLALLLLDVDSFKAYNDTYGHPAGDACLHKVGAELRAAAHRPGDLAARYGGEEFALLLPGATPAGARGVAEAVRLRVQSLAIDHIASAAADVVTISVGAVSLRPLVGERAAVLVAAADEALYRAKANGRNRVEMADDRPAARRPRPHRIAAAG